MELLARFRDWVSRRSWIWAYLAVFLELAELGLDRLQALELAELDRLFGLELAELGPDPFVGEQAAPC